MVSRASDTVKNRDFYLRCLLLSAVWLLCCIPLFFSGLEDRDGQDLVFHLLRIEGISEGLRAGEFPVRMQGLWLNGYGYSVSEFYGDVFLYFPALLRLAGFSVQASYKLFVSAVNLTTLLSADWSFRRMFPGKYTGLLCASVYLLSSYRLVNVYVRQAVGEYSAMLFLPLIAAAVYTLYDSADIRWETAKKNAVLLAAGMTGLLVTHLLSVEMVLLVLGCVCIFFWKRTFRISVLRTWLRAGWMTVCLGAFFWIPFADSYLHQRLVINTSDGSVHAIQFDGVRITDLFSFFRNPFGLTYSDVELTGEPLMMLTPGLVLMTVFIVSAGLLLFRKASGKTALLLLFSAVSLWVSSNLFPWNFIAYSVPGGKLLTQVQFPWRYLGIASLFLTILMGILIEERGRGRSKKLLAVVLIAGTLSSLFFFSGYHSGANMKMFQTKEDLDTMRIGRGEYLPYGTEIRDLAGKAILDGGGSASVLSRQGSAVSVYVCNEEVDTLLTFPFFHYRYQTAEDGDGLTYAVKDGINHQAAVTVPAYFEGILTLRFEEPILWRTAWILSFLAWACLMISLVLERKNESCVSEKS